MWILLSKGFLDSVNNNYSSYVKTDSSIDPNKSFSRGKGGISILYKKSLSPLLSHTDDMEPGRLFISKVKVKHSTPLYNICAYMPAENNLSYYYNILSE